MLNAILTFFSFDQNLILILGNFEQNNQPLSFPEISKISKVIEFFSHKYISQIIPF